jgi:hypothetical protein
MYSKTKNTLSAFVAAALFVAGVLAFSRPAVPAAQGTEDMTALPAVLADADTDDADARNSHEMVVLRSHRSNRMSLSMPYFSFVQVLPQRRAD